MTTVLTIKCRSCENYITRYSLVHEGTRSFFIVECGACGQTIKMAVDIDFYQFLPHEPTLAEPKYNM